MRERPERLYIILYRAVYTALLFGICLTGFGRYFGIADIGIWEVLFGVFILCGLLGIGFLQLRGKVISSLLVLGVLVMIPVVTGAEEGFWFCYRQWLIGKEGWEAEWVTGYELVQSCVVMAGCYGVQLLFERLSVLKSVSGVCTLGYLLFCMIQKRDFSHMAVCLSLGFLVLCFIEWTQKHWNKKKGKDDREYMLRILPFCVLLFGCIYFLPTPQEAYDWKFVKDIYQNIHEKVVIWIQDIKRDDQEDFGMARVGFSEDGSLMRGIIPDDRQLLQVKGSMGLRTNVYLTGKVYDTFDGNQWSGTVEGDTDACLMDTLETLYAVMRYDEEWAEDYIYSTGLNVKYAYFNTSCLFAPLKVKSIEGCEYSQSMGNLIFEKQVGYGTEYQLIYYQLNIDHPKFYEMAEADLPEEASVWENVLRAYGMEQTKGITLSDLTAYREKTVKQYSREVPLSPETEAYLDEITEGKETDIEKLQAIEKELQSFKYATRLENLPEDIDSESEFLEYFLLEGREGYCSYFATAFVLMARAEGIPARYAEGFCIPKTTDKAMTVTSDMAHAWPEVYLEGIGWIPFEPTPGYENIRYTPWNLKSEKEGTFANAKGEALDWEEAEEEEELVQENEPQEIEGRKGQMGQRLLLVTGIVMAGTLLILLADGLIFRRKYQKMSEENKFLVQTKRLLWLLSVSGIKRKEEETLEELQKRAESVLEAEQAFRTLTAYEAYLYGNYEISSGMLQEAAEENHRLLMRIKQKSPWHYYWILLQIYTMKAK